VTANDARSTDLRSVRIAEGVSVIQRVYKAPGGLLRATAIEREGHLHDVHLSGDFFVFPSNGLVQLEAALEGVATDTETIENHIAEFYQRNAIEAPGVTPADFTMALIGES